MKLVEILQEPLLRLWAGSREDFVTEGEFAALLRERRLRAGLTQEELAARSGVSAHSISVLEAGRRRPRLSSVNRMADALGLDPTARGELIGAARTLPEPSGSTAETGVAALPGDRGPICQLPHGTRFFSGRTAELEQLAHSAAAGGHAGALAISAIHGMGGIGKSALAIHAAHQLRGRFPDGQLFIDLHGHTPGTPAVTANDALGWLLRSLGVPPPLIPQDLDHRAAFYRDRLAGTRTLILLDNAASTAQLRPLLPGTADCLVLITSRKRLSGLDDAHNIALDVLPRPHAVALLREVADPGRISDEDPAVEELVTVCGQLPLAIRIAAGRLRDRRARSVEDLVKQLWDDRGRLELLADDDRNLTAVFDTSFAALPAAEQRVFRLLGLVPGPDFDACAVANLIGGDREMAERLLESLQDHSLLLQQAPGRYRFHDLVAAYSRTRADCEPGEQRAEHNALERLAGGASSAGSRPGVAAPGRRPGLRSRR